MSRTQQRRPYVRAANPTNAADRDLVAELLAQSPDRDLDCEWLAERVRHGNLPGLRGAFLARWSDDAAPTGAALLTSDGDGQPWRVSAMYVHPSRRRRGLGTLLLLAATDTARMCGSSALDAEVGVNRPGWLALLVEAGFKVRSQAADGSIEMTLPLPVFSLTANVALR